jgi:hypothetical protein
MFSSASASAPQSAAAVPDGVAFSRYRTFAFDLPGQPPVGYDVSASSREAERRARLAIAGALARKGYAQDGGKADFVVRLAAGARDLSFGDGETGYRPPQPEEVNVTIDFFDAASGSTVWHAVAMSGADLGAIDEARLRSAVESAIGAIPAQSSSSVASATTVKSEAAERVYP